MPKLLLISFDAVGSEELSILSKQPNFKKIINKGTLFDRMKTVFVSNTYPVHCSVATGVVPAVHGLCSNTLLDPEKSTYWNYDSRILKHKTLWQAAAEKGLKVANVLWPVTGFAPSIKWNIPEIVVPHGQSQIKANLKSGSVCIQIKEFLRHRTLLNGIRQPQLDTFAMHSAVDIINEKNPDFMLLHLTSYDSLCHAYGRMSEKAVKAIEFLDEILGELVAACEKTNVKHGMPADSTCFIIFSDHAQLNVHTNIHPNAVLKKKGFLEFEPLAKTPFGNEASHILNWRCFFQYSGGSAFFFNAPLVGKKRKGLTYSEVKDLKAEILLLDGVERLLTQEELVESGFAHCNFCDGARFGLAAKEGWYFDETNCKKATHGYTTMVNVDSRCKKGFEKRPKYDTFCAINKDKKHIGTQCSTVTDITKLVAEILDLDMQ